MCGNLLQLEWWKLNTDAAFNNRSGVATLGMALRDEHEAVLLSATGCIHSIKSSLYAEVLAVLFGLKLTVEHNFLRVIVESDAQVAIDLISKGEVGLWEGGNLLQDIHDLAATCEFCSL